MGEWKKQQKGFANESPVDTALDTAGKNRK